VTESAEGVEFMESLVSDQILKEKFKSCLAQDTIEILYDQLFGASGKLNICVIKIINNLLTTYDNYYGKYRILLNFFKKVTFQVKD
jgi:hypothetical protein